MTEIMMTCSKPHPRTKDLMGKTFGRLTVIGEATMIRNKSGKLTTRWFCKCNCGKYLAVRAASLLNGSSQSCGCKQSEAAHALNFIGEGVAAWNRIIRVIRRGAKKRGLAVELSHEEMKSICEQPCAYCGTEPNERKCCRVEAVFANGIDRVDNSKGYIAGNCVPCCTTCNKMKLAQSVQDFLAHVNKISQHALDTELKLG
jgi:hypothetical protein